MEFFGLELCVIVDWGIDQLSEEVLDATGLMGLMLVGYIHLVSDFPDVFVKVVVEGEERLDFLLLHLVEVGDEGSAEAIAVLLSVVWAHLWHGKFA
jgi:hypothetical protein